MIINNTSKLINIENNKRINIPITNNTLQHSHESTLNKLNTNSQTENPIALSFNQQSQVKRIALDSACTDSSYRASDVPIGSNITAIPSHSQLDLTTANGGHVYSEGIAIRNFPCNVRNSIHVFNNNDLHLSMHALNSFTNNPTNGTVVLDRFGFKIYNSDGNLYYSGIKNENDKLWFLPPDNNHINLHSNISPSYKCNKNQISSNSKGEEPHSMLGQGNLFIKHEPNAVFVTYQAACFFNPCDSTFENAAKMGWLGNLPRITASMIAANRPHSMMTAYGHLNRLRQNLRSTTPKPDSAPKSFLPEIVLPEEMVTKTLVMAELSPIEKKALSIYFDATGKFPFSSYDGSTYVLICVYKNYIHAETMPDRSASSYVKAYRSAFNFFHKLGHMFSIAKLDNEKSTLLEQFLELEAKVDHEFISAGSHRANKAERAIRLGKITI